MNSFLATRKIKKRKQHLPLRDKIEAIQQAESKKTKAIEVIQQAESKKTLRDKIEELQKKTEAREKKTEELQKKTEAREKKTEELQKKTEELQKKTEAREKKTEELQKKTEALEKKTEELEELQKKTEAREKKTEELQKILLKMINKKKTKSTTSEILDQTDSKIIFKSIFNTTDIDCLIRLQHPEEAEQQQEMKEMIAKIKSQFPPRRTKMFGIDKPTYTKFKMPTQLKENIRRHIEYYIKATKILLPKIEREQEIHVFYGIILNMLILEIKDKNANAQTLFINQEMVLQQKDVKLIPDIICTLYLNTMQNEICESISGLQKFLFVFEIKTIQSYLNKQKENEDQIKKYLAQVASIQKQDYVYGALATYEIITFYKLLKIEGEKYIVYKWEIDCSQFLQRVSYNKGFTIEYFLKDSQCYKWFKAIEYIYIFLQVQLEQMKKK